MLYFRRRRRPNVPCKHADDDAHPKTLWAHGVSTRVPTTECRVRVYDRRCVRRPPSPPFSRPRKYLRDEWRWVFVSPVRAARYAAGRGGYILLAAPRTSIETSDARSTYSTRCTHHIIIIMCYELDVKRLHDERTSEPRSVWYQLFSVIESVSKMLYWKKKMEMCFI